MAGALSSGSTVGRGGFIPKVAVTAVLRALVVAALCVLAAVPAAHAAFPGANGKIAFTSTRDGNDEIYTMNADGTGQTRITNNAASDAAPPGRRTGPRSRSRATATATTRSTR